MHIETLDAVHRESKRLPPIQKVNNSYFYVPLEKGHAEPRQPRPLPSPPIPTAQAHRVTAGTSVHQRQDRVTHSTPEQCMLGDCSPWFAVWCHEAQRSWVPSVWRVQCVGEGWWLHGTCNCCTPPQYYYPLWAGFSPFFFCNTQVHVQSI